MAHKDRQLQTIINNADSNTYTDNEYFIMSNVISILASMLSVITKTSRHFPIHGVL